MILCCSAHHCLQHVEYAGLPCTKMNPVRICDSLLLRHMVAKACICIMLCKCSHYCASVMMEGVKVLLWWSLKKCGSKRLQPNPCIAVQVLNHELCEARGESVVNGHQRLPRSISNFGPLFCHVFVTVSKHRLLTVPCCGGVMAKK